MELGSFCGRSIADLGAVAATSESAEAAASGMDAAEPPAGQIGRRLRKYIANEVQRAADDQARVLRRHPLLELDGRNAQKDDAHGIKPAVIQGKDGLWQAIACYRDWIRLRHGYPV